MIFGMPYGLFFYMIVLPVLLTGVTLVSARFYLRHLDKEIAEEKRKQAAKIAS